MLTRMAFTPKRHSTQFSWHRSNCHASPPNACCSEIWIFQRQAERRVIDPPRGVQPTTVCGRCVCVRFLPLCQMNLWWFFNSVSIRTFTHSARANCNSSSIPLPTLFPNLILNWTYNESRWVIVPVHLWPFLIFFCFSLKFPLQFDSIWKIWKIHNSTQAIGWLINEKCWLELISLVIELKSSWKQVKFSEWSLLVWFFVSESMCCFRSLFRNTR